MSQQRAETPRRRDAETPRRWWLAGLAVCVLIAAVLPAAEASPGGDGGSSGAAGQPGAGRQLAGGVDLADERLVEVPELSGDGVRTLAVEGSPSRLTVVESREPLGVDDAPEVVLSAEADEVVRVTAAGGGSVGYRLGDAAARPQPTDRGLVVDGAWPEVDVEVFEQPGGAKALLWVHEPLAAADGFELLLDLDGVVASTSDGHVWFTPVDDPAGEPVLWMPHGWMIDSSIDPVSGRPAYSDGVSFDLIDTGDGPAVRVTVDDGWLSDPARVFPVAVDPALAVTVDAADTYVTDGDNADHSSEPTLWAGRDPATSDANRAYVQLASEVFEFPADPTDPPEQLGHLPGFLGGKVVLGGWYSHRLAGCPTTPPDDLGVFAVDDGWAAQGLTWATQPPTGVQFGHLDDTINDGLSDLLELGDCHTNPTEDGSELVSWWVGDTLIDVAAGTSPVPLDNGMMIGAVDETTGSATELMATVGYDFAGMLIIWWSDPTVDAPVPDQPTDISPDGVVSTLQPTLGGTYTNHHPDAGRGAVLFTVTDPTGALVTVAATTPTWSGLHNDTTPDWADLQWGVTYTLRAWSVARFHDEPGWEPLITDLFFEPANASPPVTTTFTPSPVALDGVADSDVVFATETLDVTTQLGTIEAVDYHANGVPIATNEPNSIAWDTTSIDDGPVELTATVTLDDTTTWDTQPITVYVDNTTTTAIDRVELDHERGLIDLDTYAEHLVRAALGRHGLPDRYQPPAPSDPDEQVWRSGTVPLATMLAFDFDHLQAATQDLIDDLLGNDPPGSLDSPQQGGGSTSDANCLHPDQEGALLRNPDGAGWIDACNIVGEWDDPDLPVYDISFRVRSDGDGPSNDPRGVDPTPSVDDPSVPQQIYEYLAVIEASLLTFRDAGYDVSMPAPAGLGPNGYFFIEVADLSSASAAGTVRETRGMYVITLDPATAKGYAAIHEVFHLMQFTAAADTTSVDRDTYGWALESTAMYAEAYYGTLPGSPLADLSTTISRPTAFGSKGWSDPPEALRVYPSLWQAPAFSLTAEAPPRLSRVAGWANSPESNWNWGRRRHYSGGIFWQYLAEQVDDPAADIDIVFDFWDGIADENGTIDYFADILTPLVATYDIDLPDALRDFWVAIHLLDTDNNDIDRFAWQLPSSNPTRWRGSGDYGLGGALPAGDMGDGFGKDYRRLMSPSRLPVGTFETSRVVTFLSSSIPTVESGRISSGGAWVYDLEIGDFAPGSLDVTVDTDSPHVAATLIAYDSDGHPTICVRGAAPEIEQRNNAGALSVDLDHDCTDASLIITHTDPTPDTELVHFRATITHTWGGVTAVPVNFFTLEAAPLNGLHASTWIRVVRPSLGIFTGQIVKNGIEFTVHTGTAGPSGSVEYRLHFDDNMSEVVNAPPHSASTTRVGVSGYPFGTTTAITRIDVLSGHIDSWDAVAYREWAI